MPQGARVGTGPDWVEREAALVADTPMPRFEESEEVAVIAVMLFHWPSLSSLQAATAGQLMNSASGVPIGLSASEEGRCHSRSVLALG
ncbi:MAG: hypothetical protein ABJ360_22200 [Roseobacter sp.]